MINRRHLVAEQKNIGLAGDINFNFNSQWERILGGLIDQRSASPLIDLLLSFGRGYELSCKFSTGATLESEPAALEVQQLPVGVILNINYDSRCTDQVIFKFMSGPCGTHHLFLCVTGPFFSVPALSPPPPALLVLIKERPAPRGFLCGVQR